MSWVAVAFLANAVTLLVLVFAYLFLWRRGRQVAMALWGLGWAVYALCALFLAGELVVVDPAPWRFASLAAMGLGGFLLWAGTRASRGRPISSYSYAWGLLPVGWALTALLPLTVDYRIVATPVFVFSALVDLLTARALLHHGRSVGFERAFLGLASAYCIWAGLKIADLFVVNALSLLIGLLLSNGLAVGVAFSLVVLSLLDAERHARRRASRLNVLASLTGAVGRLLSPEELATAALEEVGRLLEMGGGLGVFLVEQAEGQGIVRTVVEKDLDLCVAPNDSLLLPADCLCARAIDSGRLTTVGPEHADCTLGGRATLAIPLVAQRQTLGVICVAVPRERGISVGERRTLETIGRQLGTALESADLFASLLEEKARLELLHRLGRRLSESLDVRQVAQRALDDVCGVVGALKGLILVRDPEQSRLRVAAISGFDSESVERLDKKLFVHVGAGLAGSVAKGQQSAIIDDVGMSDLWMPVPDLDDWVRSALSVPLVSRDELVGVLSLYSDRRAFFNGGHQQLVESVAATVATAMKNARMYDQTRRALQDLQELDRLRAEVVQNVSHELRTPLTLIQGYAELLLAGDMGSLTDAQREALDVIIDRTGALSAQIQDLMALRNLPSETLSMAALSLQSLVEAAVESYRRSAELVGVHLSADLPDDLPLLLGDWEHLTLALSHLLDNAIKFSPDGGLVSMRAWADGQYVHLSVQDHGIGIAPQHLGRIFERFYQADGSTTRRFGGMGVGLSLVWTIMDAHQGAIDVESEYGVGSTFTLTLPAAERLAQ